MRIVFRLFSFFLCYLAVGTVQPVTSRVLYTLECVFPALHGTVKSVDLFVLYKGEQYLLTLPDRQFQIYEQQDLTELYLLFVKPENLQLPTTNTIKSFQTVPGAPYKFFKCWRMFGKRPSSPQEAQKAASLFQPFQLYWEMIEIRYTPTGLHIPDATVIFLIDPDYVDEIRTTVVASESPAQSFPTVVFSPKVTAPIIRDMSTSMFMVAPDLRALHKRPNFIERQIDGPRKTVALPHRTSVLVS